MVLSSTWGGCEVSFLSLKIRFLDWDKYPKKKEFFIRFLRDLAPCTKGEKLNFYSSNFNNSSLILIYSPLIDFWYLSQSKNLIFRLKIKKKIVDW